MAKQLAELNDTWATFTEVANTPEPRRLTIPELTGTRSFSASDVAVFARLARQITQRSIDPRLTRMSSERAYEYVMGGAYLGSRNSARSNLINAANGVRWEQNVFNQFPEDAGLGKTHVLDVRWKWGQQAGTLGSGKTAPLLWVGVQVFTRTPVTVDGATHPIVVRRTVLVRGFNPTGGLDWWPAVTFNTWPYGNDGCTLRTSPRLVPTRRVQGLRDDLRWLRDWLAPNKLDPDNTASTYIAWPDYSQPKMSEAKRKRIQKKHDAYCAKPTP